MPVIGFLLLGIASPQQILAGTLPGFQAGLAETGYIEGKNVAIEYRWAEGHYDRLPALAADLVSRHVAVLVAGGGTALEAKAATSTIPIVFTLGAPIRSSMASSLALVDRVQTSRALRPY